MKEKIEFYFIMHFKMLPNVNKFLRKRIQSEYMCPIMTLKQEIFDDHGLL